MHRELPRKTTQPELLARLQENFKPKLTADSLSSLKNAGLGEVFGDNQNAASSLSDVNSLIGIVANPSSINARLLHTEDNIVQKKFESWDIQAKREMEKRKPLIHDHLVAQLWAPRDDLRNTADDYIVESRAQHAENAQPATQFAVPVEVRTFRLSQTKEFFKKAIAIRQDIGEAVAGLVSESFTDPFKGALAFIADRNPEGALAQWAEARIRGLQSVDEIASFIGRSGLPETLGVVGGTAFACAPTPKQVAQEYATQPPAIVENQPGVAPAQPTALPETAPVEAATSVATATTEAQPSPTPQMREIITLDGSITQEQIDLFDQALALMINEQAFSEEVNINLQPKEAYGAQWIEGSDAHTTQAINEGYGKGPDDTTIIIVDKKLQRIYTPFSLSEADTDLQDSGVSTPSKNFDVSSTGLFQVRDESGNLLGTRHEFPRSDGTISARTIPEGAQNITADGYEFNGNKYTFNSNSGEFSVEPMPTPTPELAYEPWGTWPTQDEITTALQIEVTPTPFPLKLDKFGLPWKELSGIRANPRFVDVLVADRFEISAAYDFYYDPNNPEEKLSIPLAGYDRLEDRFIFFTTGSTIEGRIRTDWLEELIENEFGVRRSAMGKGALFIGRDSFENYRPPHYNGGLGQSDVVAQIHDALGISKEQFDLFVQTGDKSVLPYFEGEFWLFPNQTSNYDY
jgi:hypothetical protein